MLLSLSARRYGFAVTAALAANLGLSALPALAEGVPGTQSTPVPPELRRETPPPAPQPLAPGIVYGGVLTLTLESDQTLNRANDIPPFNNTYSEPELDWYVNAGKYFSINGLVKMEQVRSVTKSSAFDAEGAWTEQLYATLNFNPVQIYGGKIHPRFGRAWDDTPGVFGTDFAEDYELVEKLGVGAAVDLRWMGTHTVAFEAFQADTSFLSNSVFSRPKFTDPDVLRPGRLHRDDGGVSNTGKPNNYAVSLNGSVAAGARGLHLQCRLGHPTPQRPDRGRAQRAVLRRSAANGSSRHLAHHGVPIFEYAHVNNQGGADVRADYITAAVAFELGSRLVGVAQRHGQAGQRPRERWTSVPIICSAPRSATISGSLFKKDVRWLDGLGVEAGYKHERIDCQGLNTVGLSFTYERAF